MIERGRPKRTGAPARPARARDAAAPRRAPREPALPLPAEADPNLLDHGVRADLRGLPPAVVERVAGHLVAAGQLVDTDPTAAYAHAKAAKALAARIGSVREAVGIAAYHAGDFATAIGELRALRRLTGRNDHLAVLADCERGLGRPERALELADDRAAPQLDAAGRVELAIVRSGARRDLGQPAAGVMELEGQDLDSDAVEPWSVRLWYAYADALLAAGRTGDAAGWFQATADIDEDEETDAALRAAELSDQP